MTADQIVEALTGSPNKPYVKCKVPSCDNDMTGKTHMCGVCWSWVTTPSHNAGYSLTERTVSREAHLQKEKTKTVPCEYPDCHGHAEFDKSWTAQLCETHQAEYQDDPDSSTAHQFVRLAKEAKERANATKPTTTEKCIYPRCGSEDLADCRSLSHPLCKTHKRLWSEGCIYNVQKWVDSLPLTPEATKPTTPENKLIVLEIQGLGFRAEVESTLLWNFEPYSLTESSGSRERSEPFKIYVEPNKTGSLKVTHKLPNGVDFVQEFKFGDIIHREDRFDVNWSQHLNLNDPISDVMMRRIKEATEPATQKPITVNIDHEQMRRLGAGLLSPGNELRKLKDLGWRMSEEQIKAIENAIALQTPEGCFAAEKVLDTCDNSPNTYEVTEEPQEQKTMNTKDLYTLPILKEDAADAGIRLAGRQFTKLTRDTLAAAISGHLAPGDDSMRAKVGDFLKTDLGESLLQLILSVGLGTLPASTGNIPALLSRELRVASMLGVGDFAADLLMAPLREVTSIFLAGLPKEPAALEVQTTSVVKVNVPVEAEVTR